MNNAATLGAALAALGYTVLGDKTHTIIGSKQGEEIRFRRGDSSSAFQVTGDTDHLAAIGRKYGEVGVRAWARVNKFSVLDNEGDEMTIVRRTI
jgi:hypothetical protein